MATNGFWMDALNFKLSNIAQSNSKLFMSSFTFLLSAASLLLMILKCLVAIKFYVQLCIFAQIVCFWWSRNTFLAIKFYVQLCIFWLKLFAFGDLEIIFLRSRHRTLGIPAKWGFSHQKEEKMWQEMLKARACFKELLDRCHKWHQRLKHILEWKFYIRRNRWIATSDISRSQRLKHMLLRKIYIRRNRWIATSYISRTRCLKQMFVRKIYIQRNSKESSNCHGWHQLTEQYFFRDVDVGWGSW